MIQGERENLIGTFNWSELRSKQCVFVLSLCVCGIVVEVLVVVDGARKIVKVAEKLFECC